MDKSTRSKIESATQAGRKLLEEAYREQLEGTFDILLDGTIAEFPGAHLSPRERLVRVRLIDAINHKRSQGFDQRAAVDAYLREAAFTTLNRFVALKMLEARGLIQECISKGEGSSGFREFSMLAPGLVALEDKGYRLYIECLFDEIAQEVKVLFDRQDVASLLWPQRQSLLALLDLLNHHELSGVWGEDETIGWVYQYFNGNDERTKMRDESQAPRNSRELAVRNQFFTPRYVVQFLTDNTLGRTWYEMMQGKTELAHLEYRVSYENEIFLAPGQVVPVRSHETSGSNQASEEPTYIPFRPKKDPRELKIIDPACGSGHFLLYTFDLLLVIYQEAWHDVDAGRFNELGTTLKEEYPTLEALKSAVPELILRYNVHGVDIDPRAAQIAALALWMRAQRALNEYGVKREDRPYVTKTNFVVAEPMPGDEAVIEEFAQTLDKPLADLFKKMVSEMKLAGELGSLLPIERSISKAIEEAAKKSEQGELFSAFYSQEFWDHAEKNLYSSLEAFASSAKSSSNTRHQLFAGDTAQGLALIYQCRKRYDVVLMNPPFGAGSLAAKKELQAAYPRTKNDLYAAFVERGVQLLHPSGYLGAITSRTGFFLSSFQKWREEILLREAPPTVFADLGMGVLDNAMVEVAAYCLKKVKEVS